MKWAGHHRCCPTEPATRDDVDVPGTGAGRRPDIQTATGARRLPQRHAGAIFRLHEVLAPELVRGQGAIGDVFNLLYIATRVRWRC
jgi:hypothetical protein